jgi:hypothetical protein
MLRICRRSDANLNYQVMYTLFRGASNKLKAPYIIILSMLRRIVHPVFWKGKDLPFEGDFKGVDYLGKGGCRQWRAA